MTKIINLENEKKFIKNKEHLSKEDYERLAEIETELKEIKDVERNLCDSCVTKGCVFQSGIIRSHCDFYTESEVEE